MNKISDVFKNKKALITYLTAGDPNLEKTKEFILTMAKSGAGLIEIGIPFSDPIAEGEVIQNAMMRALKNNINVDNIFNMVSEVRKETNIPLAFMTYLNPVFSYGYARFFKKCKELGIGGIIIPDMPFEEQDEIKEFAQKNEVSIITLIAPSSKERIAVLAKAAEGFIYLISSLGVTGMRDKITTDIAAIVSQIKAQTQTPVAVGFGISKAQQAKEISQYADGIIIGSAIVKIIAEYAQDAAPKIAGYVSSIKSAIE
jgi:tryptophan synthase alpha chain